VNKNSVEGRPAESASDGGAATRGLRFSEAMRGYMGPGDEHRAGYEAGRSAGRRVEFRVTIVIDDMDRFLDDPEHEAMVSGEVDIAGIGSRMPIEAGRFHLMCRREGRRRMLYHLPFEREGRRYLLWGEKRIEDDPGFDVWKDSTTLFAELTEAGADYVAVGPPVLTGVLRISVLGVLRQLATFRTQRARRLPVALSTLIRFMRFFSREIRATYGRFPW
jgi:cholesterol oxidase